MFSVLWAFANFVVDLFKSRRRLEAENLLLRQQLNVALRYAPRRLRLCGVDRAVLVGLVRFWPDLARSVRAVKPETVALVSDGVPHLLALEIAEGGRAAQD